MLRVAPCAPPRYNENNDFSEDRTMDIWTKLYNEARAVQNGRMVSPFIKAGYVAAALETASGTIYTGVAFDTPAGLGICAERAGIVHMLKGGEHLLKRVVCVKADGSVAQPCGACRELMMQLHKDAPNIEVMTDYENRTVKTLGELLPDWWGRERFE